MVFWRRPALGPLGPFTPWERFPCTMLATEGHNMATSASECGRCASASDRRLTIDVSEDDLRALRNTATKGDYAGLDW
jgi:hypothetical protein